MLIATDFPMQITGPGGTSIWIGTGPLGMVYEVVMISQTVTAGQVICAQGANNIIHRPDYVAADIVAGTTSLKQRLAGVIGTATTTLGPTLGVALEPCTSTAAGAVIRVAGVGSVVAVQTTANGTLGQYCVRAAAGQVTPANTAAAMIGVGLVAKVGPLTGGGGVNHLGVLVQPGLFAA